MSEESPGDLFRERLRTVREKLRGMSQVELARVTGLPATSIAHFERGTRKPSFESLRKVAIALNVSTDYLLGRVDVPHAGAPADSLSRYGDQLSARDLALAEDILRVLVERALKERDGRE